MISDQKGYSQIDTKMKKVVINRENCLVESYLIFKCGNDHLRSKI